MNETVFITGGTGFIGRNLIRQLMKEKRNVHILIRSRKKQLLFKDIPPENFHYYDGSLKSIDLALDKSMPSVVFHLATTYIAEHAPSHLQSILDSNISLGVHLLEALSAHKVSCLINTSTALHCPESKYNHPANLYTTTKQAFETFISYYSNVKKFKAVTLRLFDTYGPYDERPKVLPALFKASKTNEELNMSPGHQKLDLLHVDDVIKGLILAAKYARTMQSVKHEAFNLQSGKLYSIREIVEIFSKVTKTPMNVNWGAIPYRKREVMTPLNDGKCLPNWVPSISLEEGIKLVLTTLHSHK